VDIGVYRLTSPLMMLHFAVVLLAHGGVLQARL